MTLTRTIRNVTSLSEKQKRPGNEVVLHEEKEVLRESGPSEEDLDALVEVLSSLTESEWEVLDELSRKTLRAYQIAATRDRTKAVKGRDASARRFRDQYYTQPSWNTQIKTVKKIQQHHNRAEKRSRGLTNVKKRLNQASEGLDWSEIRENARLEGQKKAWGRM